MRITKTTINMARRRGIAIVKGFSDEDPTKIEVEICGVDEDGEAYDEYHALYHLTADGMFWQGTCFNRCEDWPYWIADEAQLRNLLDAMQRDIYHTK